MQMAAIGPEADILDMNEFTEEYREKEWHNLYQSLTKELSKFGRNDAFGEGDYWLIDDDYGDTSHKICVARAAFITPLLLATIQQTVLGLTRWRVVIQIDEGVDGKQESSTGYTVHHDRVEHSPSCRRQ